MANITCIKNLIKIGPLVWAAHTTDIIHKISFLDSGNFKMYIFNKLHINFLTNQTTRYISECKNVCEEDSSAHLVPHNA